ncbi:hypothetical protein [Streptomyces achromogenes]|uniref:hypothetical protein n=1 Tax=Streptomyces achromogenes TaxID=67255 RepID=UPI00344646B0
MFHNPTVPLAPMTPDAVLSAFGYLREVEAGDTEAAADLADAAQQIIVPVTALCGTDPNPCDHSFALEAVGHVLMAPLRGWAQAGPDGLEGIAHAVITFVRQILTHEESGETVADVLRQMEAVGFGQALEAHPPPSGAPRCRVVRAPRGGGAYHDRAARHRTGLSIAVRAIGAGAPHQAHARVAGAYITHPLVRGLIGGRKALRQGETGRAAEVVKGGARRGSRPGQVGHARTRPHSGKRGAGARTNAVRRTGCTPKCWARRLVRATVASVVRCARSWSSSST